MDARPLSGWVLAGAAAALVAVILAALLELPLPLVVGMAVLLGGCIGAAGGSLSRSSRKAEASPPPADTDPTTNGEADHLTQLILSLMDEGIVLFDESGTAAFANDASRGLLGSAPTSLTLLMPVALRDLAQRALAGDSAVLEIETGNPARWLRAQVSPADDGVLLLVRDITEERRLNAVRTDFVANASHELKTPVASIRAVAETLQDAAADDPEAVARFTEQLDKEARRLSLIVADLLDLSRLEATRSERVTLDLATVVEDEAMRLADAARAADITLEVARAEGPIEVRGDEDDLRLLVRNLVDNAIRYSSAGGRVTVTVEDGAGTTTVRVKDEGIGIPQRDLPRVFERFYRVDRARARQTGGTGLGLAIVKHVAESHGGSVTATSELGVGTEFSVRLPTA